MADFEYAKKRTFIAVDTTDLDKIEHILQTFGGKVRGFKFGIEAIFAHGLAKLTYMANKWAPDAQFFADTKAHDIPTTIGKASQAIMGHKVCMFNIHASAGAEAISAAAQAVAGTNVILLGVTVLTSFDDADCTEMYGRPRDFKVMELADLMAEFGGPNAGIICSANEVSAIKADPKTRRLIAGIPGIRLLGDSGDDQKNIVTPGQSWQAGADFEVIGRSVTSPANGTSLEALARVEESYDEVAATRCL